LLTSTKVGYIEPVPNSHIGFEVWLPPANQWNNRNFGVGNPAFEGAIKYQGLKGAVEKNYAMASTDTGHQDPGHKWAQSRPERLIDWTHRAGLLRNPRPKTVPGIPDVIVKDFMGLIPTAGAFPDLSLRKV
jgi:hypothetical protein